MMRLVLAGVFFCMRKVVASVPEVTFNVLIAGFGGNNMTGPGAIVAERLDNSCQAMVPGRRVCFSGWNLTMDRSGASEVQRSLEMGQLQRVGVDAIVILGFESKAKGLKFELAGSNQLAESTRRIDASQSNETIAPPTFDLSRLEAQVALSTIQTDALFSRDAGSSYCNEALYRTASTIRKLKVTHPRDPTLLLPFAFLHLPDPSVAPIDLVAPAIADLAKTMLIDVLHDETYQDSSKQQSNKEIYNGPLIIPRPPSSLA